jgi:hypothetical protein
MTKDYSMIYKDSDSSKHSSSGSEDAEESKNQSNVLSVNVAA